VSCRRCYEPIPVPSKLRDLQIEWGEDVHASNFNSMRLAWTIFRCRSALHWHVFGMFGSEVDSPSLSRQSFVAEHESSDRTL
jgi:hypothetical protein